MAGEAVTFQPQHAGTMSTKRLNDYSDSAADDNAAFDVDIVGCSRGATEARDFANKIASNVKDIPARQSRVLGTTLAKRFSLRNRRR